MLRILGLFTLILSGLSSFGASRPSYHGDWERLRETLPASESFAMSVVNFTTDQRIAWHGDKPLAISSAARLYVMGGVLKSLTAESLDWSTASDGQSAVTLEDDLRQMLAGNDRAADHLMHQMSREYIESLLPEMGNQTTKGNFPFLYAWELDRFRQSLSQEEIDRYLKGNRAFRVKFLEQLFEDGVFEISSEPARAPLWDSMDWYATTDELCAGLRWVEEAAGAPKPARVRDLLRATPQGGSDGHWTFAGAVSGEEPGVTSVAWLLKSRAQTGCVALTGNGESAEIVARLSAKALAFAERVIR